MENRISDSARKAPYSPFCSIFRKKIKQNGKYRGKCPFRSNSLVICGSSTQEMSNERTPLDILTLYSPKTANGYRTIINEVLSPFSLSLCIASYLSIASFRANLRACPSCVYGAIQQSSGPFGLYKGYFPEQVSCRNGLRVDDLINDLSSEMRSIGSSQMFTTLNSILQDLSFRSNPV